MKCVSYEDLQLEEVAMSFKRICWNLLASFVNRSMLCNVIVIWST
jgi:hypothetical protein